MRNSVLVFVAIAGCSIGRLAFADGLVFQLPPDETWARYAVKTEADVNIADKVKLSQKLAGTLTLSSVGKVTRNEQACRWIELNAESKSEGAYPQLLLKMLIPEERLQRGQDPLAHAVLTFFDPKPVDEKVAPAVESFIDDGFNRVQYEIDRFRGDFPKPLDNSKSLPNENLETPVGRFEDCEIFTGSNDYDGPLLGGGRSVFKATYRIAIHPKSPFGVVSMQIEMDGSEFGNEQVVLVKCKRTLTLMETGEDAVSALSKGSIEKPE